MSERTCPASAFRLILAAFALLLTLAPGTAQALTERDWMIALVDSLGRSFGLPDQPQSEDYLNILQGKRNIRFEAETVHSEDDEVSALAFQSYGPFSGSGWILGTSKPSKAHLRFVLPLDGRYRLGLGVHRAGHTVQVGDRQFTADGDALRFSRVEVGEVQLTAGPQEITVTLPPGGALDYIELSAPNLPAIVPGSGWQEEAPLTWETLAVTSVQALDLGSRLPETPATITVEAESLSKTGEARVVDDAHLGQPSGGQWLRTSAQPARVEVPLDLAQPGFYQLELAVLGAPIDIMVNAHLSLTVDGKPYIDKLVTPTVFLPKGPNSLELTLPPGGGVDSITFRARQSDLPAMAAVLGLTMTGEAPTTTDIDQLTARLAAANR